METEAQQAREALTVIARAQALAARNGKNNGTVPLVWGAVILAVMIGFDVGPRLFPHPSQQLTVAAVLLGLIPVGTALWTAHYQRRLPVQPLTVDRPRLFAYWGVYHMAVLWTGIGLGHWLGAREHLHGLPPFAMTLTGLVDAAPLFWVGWTQRQRAREGWE